MMDDKLRAYLAFLLLASLRDQNVHRHAAMVEWRTAFTPREDGATEARDAEVRTGPLQWGGAGLRDV